MPSSLSAAMKTEMAGLNRVHPVIEIVLDGTTYRFAGSTVASESAGLYKGLVTNWGSWSRHAGHSNFSLERPEFQVEIFDEERVLQKVIGGPAKGTVRGSAFSRWWRSFYVPTADHYKAFDGIVQNYSARDRNYSFRVSPDTAVLDSTLKIPFLTKADFPTAPDAVVNQPLWIVVGSFASGAVPNAAGMVKCVPATLDANGKSLEWIVSYGQGVITALYYDGVKDTANWQFYLQQRGKNFYQMAHYVGGTNPVPTSQIFVDLQGIRAEAPHVTGGGTTITNPAKAMRRILGHFAYGDGDMRPGVSWTSETGIPVATEIWDAAETYFSDREDKMARVIRGDRTVSTIFSEWCDDFSAVPFWSDGWKIGAIPENEGEVTIYQDTRHVAQKLGHALSELSMSTTRSRPVESIQVNYLLNEAAGEFAKSGLITDPRAVTSRSPLRSESRTTRCASSPVFSGSRCRRISSGWRQASACRSKSSRLWVPRCRVSSGSRWRISRPFLNRWVSGPTSSRPPSEWRWRPEREGSIRS